MSEQPTNPELDAQSEHFRTDHLTDDLKGRSIRGGAVTMASQAVNLVLSVGSTMVLARLLTPDDFGLVAMVTAITGFVLLFKDLGLSMATVQKKDITHDQVSGLFWINVGLSAVAMLLTAAAAPVIAWFYKEPRLTWISLAVAGSFLIGGLATQHHALLRRQMRFMALAVLQIVSSLVGIVGGITCAVLGMGYWSLVIMNVLSLIAGTVGLWLMSGWRPGAPVRRSGLRSLVAFGGHLAAFDTVNYFARNLDNILIGRAWGAVSLGFYSKAYNLLLLPLRQINAPVSAVAIPALSHLQDQPERFRSYYLKSLSLIIFVTTPLAIFCLVMADEIILAVLGPKWMEAAYIFRLLAISGAIQPIYNTAGLLYVPTGRAKEQLKYASIGVVLIVASFFIGLPFGARGVALSYSCAMLVWLVPSMYFAARGTCVRLRDIFAEAAHVFCGAFLGGLGLLAAKYLLGARLGLWPMLGFCVCIMAGLHIATVFLFFGRREFYISVFKTFMSGEQKGS